MRIWMVIYCLKSESDNLPGTENFEVFEQLAEAQTRYAELAHNSHSVTIATVYKSTDYEVNPILSTPLDWESMSFGEILELAENTGWKDPFEDTHEQYSPEIADAVEASAMEHLANLGVTWTFAGVAYEP